MQTLIGIALISIFALLVFILFISIIYFAGYFYDSIFGNIFLKVGRFFAKKFPKIKQCNFLKKCWMKIQPKEVYLRYETPICSYCFSYTAILSIAALFPNKYDIGLIIASGIYIICYFVGMARRCGNDAQHYEKVLNNNMEFLKLSFLPLGFIITVLGFLFTATGMNVREIPIDFSLLKNGFASLMHYSMETYELITLLQLFGAMVVILVLFYIVSLPIQVLSYFIISFINYFGIHKKGYIILFKKCRKLFVTLFFHRKSHNKY